MNNLNQCNNRRVFRWKRKTLIITRTCIFVFKPREYRIWSPRDIRRGWSDFCSSCRADLSVKWTKIKIFNFFQVKYELFKWCIMSLYYRSPECSRLLKLCCKNHSSAKVWNFTQSKTRNFEWQLETNLKWLSAPR